jgi:hypothetical protein
MHMPRGAETRLKNTTWDVTAELLLDIGVGLAHDAECLTDRSSAIWLWETVGEEKDPNTQREKETGRKMENERGRN